jgi:hypothetical protein
MLCLQRSNCLLTGILGVKLLARAGLSTIKQGAASLMENLFIEWKITGIIVYTLVNIENCIIRFLVRNRIHISH